MTLPKHPLQGPQSSPSGDLPGDLPTGAQWGDMDDPPDHRWLNYREIADALGLPSVKAAAHRTRRAGWRREEGNGPAIRVAVPVSVLDAPRGPPRREGSALVWGGPPQPSPGTPPTLPDGALVGELRERLARSQGELDGLRVALRVAEAAAAEANQRAMVAQAEAAVLRGDVVHERAQAIAARHAQQAAEQDR